MKTKHLICLISLAILDMLIPIPIVAIALIFIMLQKPAWFRDWVDEIYRR